MNNKWCSIDEVNEKYWKKIHHPYRGGFELTSLCNMSCSHCYLRGIRSESKLNKYQIFKILDKLFNEGTLFLYFTGGEVFTRNDFVDIYIYAKRKGFLVSILTNATLINDEIIDVFNKYPPFLVSISIYGCTEDVYNRVTNSNGYYNKFCNALDILSYNGIQFELKFIVLKENYHQYNLAKELAEKYDVDFSHGIELFPTLEGDTRPIDIYMLTNQEIINFESEHEDIKKVWQNNIDKTAKYSESESAPLFICAIDCGSFLIDKDGYLYPCSKMRFNKKHHILSCDFTKVYKGYTSYKKLIASKDFICQNCPYISICNPCPAINKLATGDFEKPYDRLCQLNKCRIEAFSLD